MLNAKFFATRRKKLLPVLPGKIPVLCLVENKNKKIHIRILEASGWLYHVVWLHKLVKNVSMLFQNHTCFSYSHAWLRRARQNICHKRMNFRFRLARSKESTFVSNVCCVRHWVNQRFFLIFLRLATFYLSKFCKSLKGI